MDIVSWDICLPLLPSRGLHVQGKGRLYFASVCSVVLYRTNTWLLKGQNEIRLERNPQMVKW